MESLKWWTNQKIEHIHYIHLTRMYVEKATPFISSVSHLFFHEKAIIFSRVTYILWRINPCLKINRCMYLYYYKILYNNVTHLHLNYTGAIIVI